MLNYSDILRGLTDTIILAQLYKEDSYGYQINKTISDLSGKTLELKEATLYTSFRRLEESGLISSYWGDENSGARRRYYSITERGKQAYEENKNDWQSIQKIMSKLINENLDK
ncbi:MAG: PadR family transcriptional regulator [Spirochaetia bacterium]|nr:PadR family transcriptional regulator [Spirochaetia bacterium]MDD7269640.1 PadR family transcriptional regulator [Treponema sp.]MDY4985541.1 PadR family transcriptional regulator [Treponema sp.]